MESANSFSERFVNASPKCRLSVDSASDTRNEWLELGASTTRVAGASIEVGLIEVGFSTTFAKFGCVEFRSKIDREAATVVTRANLGFLSV